MRLSGGWSPRRRMVAATGGAPALTRGVALLLPILLLTGCAPPPAQITEAHFLRGARGLDYYSSATDESLIADAEGLCESLYESGGENTRILLTGYFEELEQYPGEAEAFLRLSILRYCPDVALSD